MQAAAADAASAADTNTARRRPAPVAPPDIDPLAPTFLMLEISQAQLARGGSPSAADSAPTMPFRARAFGASGDAVRYHVYRPAGGGGLAEETELVVKGLAGADLWRVSYGRDAREKYAAKPGRAAAKSWRDYKLQVLVQTWLRNLPKRALVLAVPAGARQGQPVLLIHGDALCRRFSIESIATAKQVARVKRITRFQSLAGDRTGARYTAEIVEWEMKIHEGVDAALIVTLTCLLEGWAAGGGAEAPPPGSRRSRARSAGASRAPTKPASLAKTRSSSRHPPSDTAVNVDAGHDGGGGAPAPPQGLRVRAVAGGDTTRV
jgi:hypothetical protein